MDEIKKPELVEKSSQKAGLPPGSLVYIGEATDKIKITLMEYDDAQLAEKEVKEIGECFPIKDKPTVTWINVEGVQRADIIEKIGKHLNIHPLVLEDIMNTEQRPKAQDFGDYIFVVLKTIDYREKSADVVTKQMSLIIGENFLVSFEEGGADVFNPIRERIRNHKSRKKMGRADHLAYYLIDMIVDKYFLILEKLGERIAFLDEELVTNPAPLTLQSIHDLKRELIMLRKSVWPSREMLNCLERTESPIVDESTRAYFRDVQDHLVRVMDTIETYREMTSGMIDVYLSSISYKLNEVMKILTIITTIFIPLTFIAGVYGMNFTHMPELSHPLGYPLVLIGMSIIMMAMLIFFRRKKWI